MSPTKSYKGQGRDGVEVGLGQVMSDLEDLMQEIVVDDIIVSLARDSLLISRIV